MVYIWSGIDELVGGMTCNLIALTVLMSWQSGGEEHTFFTLYGLILWNYIVCAIKIVWISMAQSA